LGGGTARIFGFVIWINAEVWIRNIILLLIDWEFTRSYIPAWDFLKEFLIETVCAD
jgi:hypothetical protein